jgi:uncharacterized protein (TIGR04255 family)
MLSFAHSIHAGSNLMPRHWFRFEEAMPIPDSPRVQYKKNPLVEVICQVRFPAILRIETHPPVEFQEQLRQQYPLFIAKQGVNIEIPSEIARSEIVKIVGEHKSYEFTTADEQWTVSLTKDFLALTSREYERWEEFQRNLALPLEALNTIYAPVFYSRIGLRYRDVIQMSQLGLMGVEWAELLNPYLVGELASPDLAQEIVYVAREFVMQLQDGRQSQAHVRHGLVQVGNTEEIGYLIDSDFFTEQRTEIKDALEALHYFNQQAGRLFRWCLTDRLHNAMEPETVG